jgi:hypothetical protein
MIMLLCWSGRYDNALMLERQVLECSDVGVAGIRML